MSLTSPGTSLTTRGTSSWTALSVAPLRVLSSAGRRTKAKRIRMIKMRGLTTAQARSAALRSGVAFGREVLVVTQQETRPSTLGTVLAGHTEEQSSEDGRKEHGWQRTPSPSS